jgi:tryptophan 2,3-dioxygenase
LIYDDISSFMQFMSQTEDFSQPVLAGGARSDYERYLNTDELLALQKTPEEWVHRDELLFQVTHQSSELWLKLAGSELDEAAACLDAGRPSDSVRALRRIALCIRLVTSQLDMLEHMSPWEYQEIRKVLGHGSGFDSPGFRSLRKRLAPVGKAFERALADAGLTLAELYVHGREHDTLYQVAEALTEVDEWVQMWRVRHFRVVGRTIGDKVVGTQGTPVEVLGRLVSKVEFPELWELRNQLTAQSKVEA